MPVPPEASKLELAILGQSMRVAYLTLTVLEETELANENSPPKPFIPGT